MLLNIGGIANITYLPRGGGIEDVVAFDTGPGNCISDYLVRQADGGGAGHDAGGKMAASGRVIEEIVEGVMGDEYFAKGPPKSTDGKGMIEIFLKHAAPTLALPRSTRGGEEGKNRWRIF